MKFEPKISLVIPAYNEERVIGNVLKTIKESKYPKKKMEIIIVGDCSTDKTDKIIRKFIKDNPEINTRLLKDKHEGVGAARNLGWKSAKYNLITMLDADHEMTPNYLHEIVKPLKNQKIHGADPITFLKNKKNILARLYWHKDRLGEEVSPANFRVFRREVLEKINGYNNELSAYDDQDSYNRAIEFGFKTIKNKNAILYHTYTGTLKDMWNDNRWRGAALIKLFMHSPKKAIRIGLFPLICNSVLISLLLLLTPFYIFGIIGLILFFLIEIKRMWGMWKNEKWLGILLTPIFDTFDMFLYTIGIVKGIFRLKKKALK